MAKTAYTQTEIDVHALWADLTLLDQRAGATLHVLCGMMISGCEPVVVISQKQLAERLDCSVRTMQRVINKLRDNNWVEVLNLGPGTVQAYRVNSRAAWTQESTGKISSHFSAAIVCMKSDQDAVSKTPLQNVTAMLDGNIIPVKPAKKKERQLELAVNG